MPRGTAAINALWRERQEAAARAQEEAEALALQQAADGEMPKMPESESDSSFLPTPPAGPSTERSAEMAQSAQWWLSNAQWRGIMDPGIGSGPSGDWLAPRQPIPHPESGLRWGSYMPAPTEYPFKKFDLPASPPGVDINNNIELARMFANKWSWPMAFYHLVKTTGPWDFKHHFGPQYEDFGNFHYGATAAAAFPNFIIYNEAGKNQYYGQNRGPESWGEPASRLSYLFPGVGRGTYRLGDDPWDRYWIERGIRYYNDKYRK
jgi:putative RNase toxin 44 of polymorphic toxin system